MSSAPSKIAADVNLLVVGAPNHAARLSKKSTREQAAEHGATFGSPEIGVREWLAGLEVPPGIRAAAYDTRLAQPGFMKLVDRAARTISKRLRSRGCRMVGEVGKFQVMGEKGPLADGELDQARQWAGTIAAQITAAGTGAPRSR